MLLWDLYEIRASSAQLHGVKLRGRVRKFSIENELTCLLENASDEENVVRFALLTTEDVQPISGFVQTLIPEAVVSSVGVAVPNPVLSKLKVNDVSRYED